MHSRAGRQADRRAAEDVLSPGLHTLVMQATYMGPKPRVSGSTRKPCSVGSAPNMSVSCCVVMTLPVQPSCAIQQNTVHNTLEQQLTSTLCVMALRHAAQSGAVVWLMQNLQTARVRTCWSSGLHTRTVPAGTRKSIRSITPSFSTRARLHVLRTIGHTHTAALITHELTETHQGAGSVPQHASTG